MRSYREKQIVENRSDTGEFKKKLSEWKSKKEMRKEMLRSNHKKEEMKATVKGNPNETKGEWSPITDRKRK